MSTTEARAINTVLRYLLGIRRPTDQSGDELEDSAEAAATFLAGRAHDRLGAGLTSDEVAEAWESVALGPWHDDYEEILDGYGNAIGGPVEALGGES